MKKLLAKIQRDYPNILFSPSGRFKWAFDTRTIFYDASHENAAAFLLHELAHACLNHAKFRYDIELVKKESEAWAYASDKLALKYGVTINEDTREDAIDSYRDWLHARSLCPQCQSNCLQTKTGTYSCMSCGCQWRANKAQLCELRRYRLKQVS